MFVSLVGFAGLGLLWFRVIEPVLLSFGIIRYDQYDNIMSNEPDVAPAAEPEFSSSERQTDQTQTPDQTAGRARVPVDALRSLRQHGYSRNEARELLRLLGLPLDNNLWSQAAPAPPADELPRTPWGGRPYDPAAYYQDEPELQFRPLKD